MLRKHLRKWPLYARRFSTGLCDLPTVPVVLGVGISALCLGALPDASGKANPSVGLFFLSLFYTLVMSWFLAVRRMNVQLLIKFFWCNFFILLCVLECFCRAYQQTGILPSGKIEPVDLVYDRETCFYFSVITWTTVGYGDFVPSVAARKYAEAEALMGYFFMGLAMGVAFYLISLGVKQNLSRNHPLA